ncbi:MAG: serine/threonine protein kinase [Gammaproteobacteria bacterium]|nr:serine/threonine protein kinase [Gammaproteobacteria bacterium]
MRTVDQSAAPAAPPYQDLGPEAVLDAVESTGLRCDGSSLALNSYENRVYQIGIEDAAPVVAKFYRPGRWSREAILEEHAFALELAEREIPVVAPERAGGETLHEHAGFLFAIYPRRGGRWPELRSRDARQLMGRFIGRMHATGATVDFRHRPALDVESFGVASRAWLLDERFIPPDLEPAYRTLTADLLERIDMRFAAVSDLRHIRLHGDCHPGNILWTETGAHIVDLDDCRMGPAIQDLWMLISGDEHEMAAALDDLIAGYSDFHELDHREVTLIESLRTLRMMHYAAWLARRWHDPAFPRAFPWFGEPRYWERHILELREQAALLD